mmetsp:Transcript_21094/g.49359  ORF Transcript_21094/g.49359 Transcript_21094/m.49359 type:complete len:81 (+) Transcript_21094:1755-1997(+)
MHGAVEVEVRGPTAVLLGPTSLVTEAKAGAVVGSIKMARRLGGQCAILLLSQVPPTANLPKGRDLAVHQGATTEDVTGDR